MSLPEPLVPAHVVLAHLPWFPLHYRKLLESEWWVGASDLSRSRNVDLWAISYGQTPAASLPDNDAKLSDFAGFGRDVDGFRRVKAEILAPWVLCSDGRWYHPDLAEVALEAWQKLQDVDLRRSADAARKRDERAQARVGSSGHPPDVHRTSRRRPSDTEAASTGPSEASRGVSLQGESLNPPNPPAGGLRTSDGRDGEEAAHNLRVQAWDALPLASKAASSPEKWAEAWAEQIATGETAMGLFRAAQKMAEHYGKPENTRRVPAAHRWLRTGRFKAFLPEPPPKPWAGPAHLRAAVVDHIGGEEGEMFARVYLDQGSAWRDLPDPAVVCATGFTAERLERRCGSIFRKAGAAIVTKSGVAA